MKFFFNIISWVFMPLLLPLYLLLILLYVPSYQLENDTNASQIFLYPSELKEIILFTFAIFILATLFSFIIMKKSNLIDSIQMNLQKDRTIPLIVTLVYNLLLFTGLHSKIPFISYYFFALVASGILITIGMLIGNRFFKISLHAAGVGLFSGFIFAFCKEQVSYQFWILVVAVLISGLVITARLYLEKHEPKEVISGFLIGFLITFLVTLVYPFI
ncbi:MAG: phosphatase PAP2 family protein [Flavobacteriia bacterium]|nr:phosphatase PAP2 family protein [Flavobacteriia bacterium]